MFFFETDSEVFGLLKVFGQICLGLVMSFTCMNLKTRSVSRLPFWVKIHSCFAASCQLFIPSFGNTVCQSDFSSGFMQAILMSPLTGYFVIALGLICFQTDLTFDFIICSAFGFSLLVSWHFWPGKAGFSTRVALVPLLDLWLRGRGHPLEEVDRKKWRIQL